MSRYGRISCSRICFQMIRVISSPSSSTTGLVTLIFATRHSPSETGPQTVRAYGMPTGDNSESPTTEAVGPEAGSEVGDVGLLGPYRPGRLLECDQLAVGQRGLHDLAYAGRAQFGLDPQVHAGDAVLAVDPGAHRPDLAGVLRDRPGHPGRGRRRGEVRRPGLEQRDDLGATVAGTDDQLLDLLRRH